MRKKEVIIMTKRVVVTGWEKYGKPIKIKII